MLPIALEEAAKIDGCNRYQVFMNKSISVVEAYYDDSHCFVFSGFLE